MNGLNISRRTARAMLFVGTCLAALPSAALAQSTDDDESAQETSGNVIIVTATKRAENLQDVPLAISAISGEDLEAAGAADLTDVLVRTPGLSLTRTTRSNNNVAIRGLSSLVQNASDFPVVSSYINEVPISEARIPDVGLLDLARVEVLRGPQGTLYGEGAMGGTIRFVTNAPDPNDFTASGTAEISSTRGGSENYRLTGVVNAPIATDVAALRVAGFYEDNAGFVDNVFTGGQNADAFEQYGGRASLLIRPSTDLSITLTGMYQKLDAGLGPIVFTQALAGVSPPQLTDANVGETTAFSQVDEFTEDELYILNGLIEYDFGFASLTSSTSYYDRERTLLTDELQTSRQLEAGFTPLTANPGLAPIFGPLGLAGPFVLQNGTQVGATQTNQIFAQEIRLVSNNTGPFRWTLGGYYREREVSSDVTTDVPDLIPVNEALLLVPPAFGGPLSGAPNFAGRIQETSANVDYRQYAVFGEVEFDITDKLTVLGGLRYLDERVEAANSIGAIDPIPGPTFLQLNTAVFMTQPLNEDEVLYKVGLSYEPDDDFLLYAQVANGVRPGGLNERANPNPAPGTDSPLTFSSDSVVSYEVGAKTSWLDNQLILNLAAFYTDWSDIQFSDGRDPQFPVTRNAASAEVKGIELELVAFPSDNFEVGGAFAYTDAEFAEDSLPQVIGGNTIFLIEEGQRLPIVADLTASMYAQWTYPISSSVDLVTYGDIALIGDRVNSTTREDTAPTIGLADTLESYVEANLRIGIETDRFSVTAFANNLFDNFAELGGAPATGFSRNTPRTIGVRLGVNY